MKGDFTRWSFDPAKHYHGVLKQQGRVDLDADWNEQGAITAHRIEAEALDVIGPSGAPAGDSGFLLTTVKNSTDLSISRGRAYLDGILCVNEQDTLIDAQPDLPDYHLPTEQGMYIAYLEVWLRHITLLDDRHILEEALGGPDTCTRAKTVWQVKLKRAGDLGSSIDCSTPLTLPASSGTLQAQAQPDPTKTGPCAIPAKAGYRSLENQLYRVEIHDASNMGNGGGATFKWSRDNGSVVTAWTGQNGNDLTVTSVGRDSVLGFAAGQWVELTDDAHELNFQPGTLVQLTNVQGLTLTIDPATAIPPSPPIDIKNFKATPKIRRWDSTGRISISPSKWLDLEDGVQVNFGAGNYLTGDYWLIPARTLTTNVDWPLDGANNPIAEPPRGIRRHYCHLAIVQFDGSKTWTVVAPCLPIFPPLTSIVTAKGIHVTDVHLSNGSTQFTELLNDSSVQIGDFLDGLIIRVVCDAPVDLNSAKPTTCFVTVDVPYPLDVLIQTSPTSPGSGVAIGFQPLILPGQVNVTSTASGSEIDLTIKGGGGRGPLDLLNGILNTGQTTSLLTHLTLKGSFIWGRDNPRMYLDGAAFGVARDGSHIGLHLPSGNGTPGSDFEMWFWLVRTVVPANVTFSPNSITAGQTSTGTVALNSPAPAGGAVIALAADSNIGTVPTSVTINEGLSTQTFSVTNTSLPARTRSGSLQVTASYAGRTAQGALTINQRRLR